MASRNGGPKSVPKPYFTDYTMAGGEDGELRGNTLKLAHMAQRKYVEMRRAFRNSATGRMITNNDNEPQARGGMPTKRVIDYSLPSKRGQPKALEQFKIVGKLVSTGILNDVVWVTKIHQLHATRGWKVYA